tara:strand:+ start:356 stop:796 length:441 start_codon:yes stop_codon:yes gene_type:complete
MNTENTDTAAVETPTQKILVHTRNEDDRKVLNENFNVSKMGKPQYITGLGMEAQKALMIASIKGQRIVTTGLPLDITASLGEVTVVRAWSTEKADGSKSQGSIPPADFYAGKIVNPEAYAKLKDNPDFIAAFTKADEVEEEISSDF